MSVKVRLHRGGTKKRPYYRMVVAPIESPRDGRFLEIVGHYHPLEGDKLEVNEESILSWLRRGARPSATAKELLKRKGIWARFQAGKTKP